MTELKEIIKLIENLREKLNKMSEDKTLTDSEIIAASQMFDAVLNEYHKIMKERLDRE
ncbi:MAG: Spo0E like sporulation regulatory protein [Firmicutes bacterium]|nr:Spo0E like sporulation regulatory protein [Bacillota bacterium]